MKKIIIIFAMLLLLVGCQNNNEKDNNQNTKLENVEKYSKTFYDTFDTVIQYTEFTDSEEKFEENAAFVEQEYIRLHKLYDNYREYEGINNVMTINQNDGKEAIQVDKDLFNLIKFSIDNYDKTLGYTNIAMGSVLEIWHDVREENQGKDDSETILPDEEELKEASKHTDIKFVVLDEENMTIKIEDPKVSLDLGAVAKGYATELIAKELEDKGIQYASINAGGNVRTINTPGPDRKTWGIALQNPDLDSDDYLEVLFIEGSNSVVSSGDYQRLFMNDGKRYHHIIDPNTLWPENRYRSVSVVTKDSGLADLLSTAIFLATPEEAEQIISNFDDEIRVLWSTDDEITYTPNMESLMQSKGAENR